MDDTLRVAIERWLIKADNDIVTARTMLATDPPVTDTASFHAQQCAEKCLKAYLVFAGIHVRRTHDLADLLIPCEGLDAEFGSLRTWAQDLTDYAVSSRYPDDWREIPVGEARAAVEKAASIMSFVQERLNPHLQR